MMIGCDLLKNLFAKIDFEYQHVVINKQCINHQTRALLGVINWLCSLTTSDVRHKW